MADIKSIAINPHIEIDFKFEYEDGNVKTVSVKEGQFVKDIVYKENGEVKTVSGVIDVINFISKQRASDKDACIHDDVPVFNQFITVTSLTIDCSGKYDSKVIAISAKNIIDIGGSEDYTKPVFAVNGEVYTTVEEAFTAIEAGGTVEITEDTSGNGLVGDKDFTFDLGGNTYNADSEMVGSTGTKTLGMQLLKDTNVVIKNGTLTSNKAKMLVQNYSNLTLEDVTLDCSDNNVIQYVLSNNNGDTVLKGNTNIYAPEGAVAFDICKYATYPAATVTVETTGKIVGKIEIDNNTLAAMEAGTHKLIIKSGTFTDPIVANYLAEGSVFNDNGDGTYTVSISE